ncbi:hypothetical protein MKX03_033388, partial [Papaver bracteatum]
RQSPFQCPMWRVARWCFKLLSAYHMSLNILMLENLLSDEETILEEIKEDSK